MGIFKVILPLILLELVLVLDLGLLHDFAFLNAVHPIFQLLHSSLELFVLGFQE